MLKVMRVVDNKFIKSIILILCAIIAFNVRNAYAQGLLAETPYQAEISQGRLEYWPLLYCQTTIAEMTKMQLANASLVEAPPEAVSVCHRYNKERSQFFFSCFSSQDLTIMPDKFAAPTLPDTQNRMSCTNASPEAVSVCYRLSLLPTYNKALSKFFVSCFSLLPDKFDDSYFSSATVDVSLIADSEDNAFTTALLDTLILLHKSAEEFTISGALSACFFVACFFVTCFFVALLPLCAVSRWTKPKAAQARAHRRAQSSSTCSPSRYCRRRDHLPLVCRNNGNRIRRKRNCAAPRSCERAWSHPARLQQRRQRRQRRPRNIRIANAGSSRIRLFNSMRKRQESPALFAFYYHLCFVIVVSIFVVLCAVCIASVKQLRLLSSFLLSPHFHLFSLIAYSAIYCAEYSFSSPEVASPEVLQGEGSYKAKEDSEGKCALSTAALMMMWIDYDWARDLFAESQSPAAQLDQVRSCSPSVRRAADDAAHDVCTVFRECLSSAYRSAGWRDFVKISQWYTPESAAPVHVVAAATHAFVFNTIPDKNYGHCAAARRLTDNEWEIVDDRKSRSVNTAELLARHDAVSFVERQRPVPAPLQTNVPTWLNKLVKALGNDFDGIAFDASLPEPSDTAKSAADLRNMLDEIFCHATCKSKLQPMWGDYTMSELVRVTDDRTITDDTMAAVFCVNSEDSADSAHYAVAHRRHQNRDTWFIADGRNKPVVSTTELLKAASICFISRKPLPRAPKKLVPGFKNLFFKYSPVPTVPITSTKHVGFFDDKNWDKLPIEYFLEIPEGMDRAQYNAKANRDKEAAISNFHLKQFNNNNQQNQEVDPEKTTLLWGKIPIYRSKTLTVDLNSNHTKINRRGDWDSTYYLIMPEGITNDGCKTNNNGQPMTPDEWRKIWPSERMELVRRFYLPLFNKMNEEYNKNKNNRPVFRELFMEDFLLEYSEHVTFELSSKNLPQSQNASGYWDSPYFLIMPKDMTKSDGKRMDPDEWRKLWPSKRMREVRRFYLPQFNKNNEEYNKTNPSPRRQVPILNSNKFYVYSWRMTREVLGWKEEDRFEDYWYLIRPEEIPEKEWKLIEPRHREAAIRVCYRLPANQADFAAYSKPLLACQLQEHARGFNNSSSSIHFAVDREEIKPNRVNNPHDRKNKQTTIFTGIRFNNWTKSLYVSTMYILRRIANVLWPFPNVDSMPYGNLLFFLAAPPSLPTFPRPLVGGRPSPSLPFPVDYRVSCNCKEGKDGCCNSACLIAEHSHDAFMRLYCLADHTCPHPQKCHCEGRLARKLAETSFTFDALRSGSFFIHNDGPKAKASRRATGAEARARIEELQRNIDNNNNRNNPINIGDDEVENVNERNNYNQWAHDPKQIVRPEVFDAFLAEACERTARGHLIPKMNADGEFESIFLFGDSHRSYIYLHAWLRSLPGTLPGGRLVSEEVIQTLPEKCATAAAHFKLQGIRLPGYHASHRNHYANDCEKLNLVYEPGWYNYAREWCACPDECPHWPTCTSPAGGRERVLDSNRPFYILVEENGQIVARRGRADNQEQRARLLQEQADRRLAQANLQVLPARRLRPQ
jgi:hypothetical protein